MPLLMSFPRLIHPGTVNTQMVLNVDFAPTFLELAGVRAPSDMQGRSFAPMLEGRMPRGWRTSMYYRYYHYPGDHRVQAHYGVRTHRHKLIHFNNLDEWELYDLQTDPHEMHNVYSDPAQARTIARLKKELTRLRKELDDRDQFADVLDNEQQIRPVPLELAGALGDVAEHPGTTAHLLATNAARARGRKGNALVLGDGPEPTAQLLPETLSPVGKPFTFGAWCKPESTNGVLLSWGGGGSGFTLYLQDGIPHAAVRSGGKLCVVGGRQPLKAGEWSHLAAVLRANGRLALLINGRQMSAVPARGISTRPREGFTIGSDPGSKVSDYRGESQFRGLIEDVRLYWGELDSQILEDWAK